MIMLVKCVYIRHGMPGIETLGKEAQLSRHECLAASGTFGVWVVNSPSFIYTGPISKLQTVGVIN